MQIVPVVHRLAMCGFALGYGALGGMTLLSGDGIKWDGELTPLHGVALLGLAILNLFAALWRDKPPHEPE